MFEKTCNNYKDGKILYSHCIKHFIQNKNFKALTLRIDVYALKIRVRKNKRMTRELCFKYDQHLIYPTKKQPIT